MSNRSMANSLVSPRSLEIKVAHYEKMLLQSEKEKAEYKSRVAMAEGQNKHLLDNMVKVNV